MTQKVHVYELPVPPSVNDLYTKGERGPVTKTKAYAAWVKTIKPMLPLRDAGTYDRVTQPYASILWANIDHQRDLSNCFKAVEDVTAAHLGLDDRWNNDIAMKRSLVRPDGQPLTKHWCIFIVILETDDAKGKRDRTAPLRPQQGATLLAGLGGGDSAGAPDGGRQKPRRGRAAFADARPQFVQGGPAGSRVAGRGTGAAARRRGDDGGQ
jgi:hypothetical protein